MPSPTCATPFHNYLLFLEELQSLIQQWKTLPTDMLRLRSHDALNGLATKTLVRLVPPEDRKASSAFFTDSEQRHRLIAACSSQSSALAYDPTCGAGDLLIEWAKTLPVHQSLRATLDAWGQVLYGSDIHEEFVLVAKARLVLLAISLHGGTQQLTIEIKNEFPNIAVRDCFDNLELVKEATHVLMNPPYHPIPTPQKHRDWSSGQVSFAAVLLAECVETAVNGTEIHCLLPDVLRSGSRYDKWRKIIKQRAALTRCESIGQFAATVDIDVCICSFLVGPPEVVSQRNIPWWPKHTGTTFQDHCQINVGSVVPHRPTPGGPLFPFIDATTLPQSGQYDSKNANKIFFSGTTCLPPFVAVRRTSRPENRHRIEGILIVGEEPIAVENHILVLKPHQNALVTCEQIITSLADAESCNWINDRIRCRHLTVTAIRETPWKT